MTYVIHDMKIVEMIVYGGWNSWVCLCLCFSFENVRKWTWEFSIYVYFDGLLKIQKEDNVKMLEILISNELCNGNDVKIPRIMEFLLNWFHFFI